MTHVATLIADPAAPLDGAALALAREALPLAGEPRWLDAGTAADIPFSNDGENDNRAAAARIRAALADRAVDIVVQPRAHRRKKLFTDRIAAMLGFDENRANRLAVENGRLSGRVEEPILGREAKLATLTELTARLRLAPAETLAVGDGANDLAMLAAAGLGIAYRAKPRVAAQARARIEYGDLTAVLYTQGYRREEFVEGRALE